MSLEKKDIKKKLISKSIGVIAIQFGNAILGILLSIVLARYLGAYSYGHYAYIFALISVISIPTQLGLPNLLVRYISQYHSEKDFSKIRGIISWTNLVVFFLSLIIIIITYVIIHFNKSMVNERSEAFKWGILLVPFFSLSALRGASLRGLRFVVLGKLPEMIIKPVIFILFIIIFFKFFENDFISKHAMILHVLAALITFMIGSIILLKNTPKIVYKKKAEYEIKKWITVALPFLLTGGVLVINNRIAILMLGWMASPKEVGIYEIAVKGSSLVAFSLLAVNAMLAPYYSKYYTENKNTLLQSISRWGVVVSLVVSIPLALVLIFFGRQILLNFYGVEYLAGYKSLVLLVLGQLINVSAGSVGLLLNMTKYEKLVLKGIAVSTVINIALNIFFIPKFGIEGAAYSTIITFVVWNVILLRWSILYLRVNTSIFSLLYYLKRRRN